MPDALLTLALVPLAIIVVFVGVRLVGSLVDELGRTALATFAPDICRVLSAAAVRIILRGTGVDPRDLADEVAAMINAQFSTLTTRSERVLAIAMVARQVASMAIESRRIRSAEISIPQPQRQPEPASSTARPSGSSIVLVGEVSVFVANNPRIQFELLRQVRDAMTASDSMKPRSVAFRVDDHLFSGEANVLGNVTIFHVAVPSPYEGGWQSP